jgi:hypothetical protein
MRPVFAAFPRTIRTLAVSAAYRKKIERGVRFGLDRDENPTRHANLGPQGSATALRLGSRGRLTRRPCRDARLVALPITLCSSVPVSEKRLTRVGRVEFVRVFHLAKGFSQYLYRACRIFRDRKEFALVACLNELLNSVCKSFLMQRRSKYTLEFLDIFKSHCAIADVIS